MSNEDPTKSSAIRDALGTVLLDVLQKGVAVEDDEGNLVRATPPASYLAVAKDYLKTFPPVDLPTNQSPAGLLKEFAEKNPLPFPTATKGH